MTLEEQLSRDEGRRNRVYSDTVGKLTVGVGRNVSDRPFSEDEIDLMLANDIAMVRGQLAQIPGYAGLTPARRGVLENMCFNLGITRLLGFQKFLNALARSAWNLAATEMLDSKWAGQVGPRATRLAKQIVTGEWQ